MDTGGGVGVGVGGVAIDAVFDVLVLRTGSDNLHHCCRGVVHFRQRCCPLGGGGYITRKNTAGVPEALLSVDGQHEQAYVRHHGAQEI